MRGQIRKRGKSYSVVVYNGKDAKGKKNYIWETFRTSDQAQKRLTELLHQIDTGTLARPKGTLGEFTEQWLRDYVKPNLAPTTYQGYEGIYRSGIGPILGNILLKDLRPSHIQEYIVLKLSKSVSNTTVRHHITFLHSVLETAVKWQLLIRNPVDSVTMPKIVKHEMKILDEQQAHTILAEVRGTRYYPIFNLALYTGMRQSELLALQWRDVDLLMAELSVSKSSHRLNSGEYVTAKTKTDKSNRRIALSPDTCIMLRQHLDSQINQISKTGNKFTNDRLLFCENDGKPLNPDTITRHWKRIIKRLNYPPVRFHDLRHTMASWMLMKGISPKVVQERLGHASISTTLDIYSHVTPGMQRQAVEIFDKILTHGGD
ncbi:MAG: site-specific integrase [Dehalococcoidales bacterium]|jgi:integrase